MPLPRVTVVGLGPAGTELLTSETADLLASGLQVCVRTRQHPAAEGLAGSISCDDLYEEFDSFEAVYAAIVERLVSEAEAHRTVIYAVPGSPMVAERTVELLREESRVSVDIRPALSFVDLAWRALGVDPMAEGVTIVDAHNFLADAAGRSGPMLVAQVHSVAVLDDVWMALRDSPPSSVTVLKGLGTADEVVERLDWDDLDHSIAPDHLTSLWIPHFSGEARR